MNSYDIGDAITLTAAFTSRALTRKERETFLSAGTLPEGVGVEPTAVTCTVRSPSDVNTEPEVSGEDGIYTATVQPELAGTWSYAFDGTGAQIAAGEGSFKVREQAVPR